MPPKRFEGKFGIPSSHNVESQLTSALYRLPEVVGVERVEKLVENVRSQVDVELERKHEAWVAEHAEEEGGPPKALSEKQIRMLYLKLARHFEHADKDVHLDIPNLVDALVDSPKFLESDRGSIDKLYELHEVKTLQKIAELRRKRAEMTGKEDSNPYEALFETASGNYYMARLLNMPHLQAESEYMHHCVGTSSSYVNKMKKGEVEILSFRKKGADEPVATLEYDLKRKRLLQVSTKGDDSPTAFDKFTPDLLEAIEKLPATATEAGESRIVNGDEVQNLRTISSIIGKSNRREQLTGVELSALYEVDRPLTVFNGEQHVGLKGLRSARNVELDLPVIFNCTPADIARTKAEIKETTKAYIGPLEPGVLDALPDTLEHVYTEFPNERVKFRNVALGTGIKDGLSFERAILGQGKGINIWAQQLLESADFKVVDEPQSTDLVEVSVLSLGFTNFVEYDVICARAQELGLGLCPAEVGPQLRLQYNDQPQGEDLAIAMEPISDHRGDPCVFSVYAEDGLYCLGTDEGRPRVVLSPATRFVFFRPRKS